MGQKWICLLKVTPSSLRLSLCTKETGFWPRQCPAPSRHAVRPLIIFNSGDSKHQGSKPPKGGAVFVHSERLPSCPCLHVAVIQPSTHRLMCWPRVRGTAIGDNQTRSCVWGACSRWTHDTDYKHWYKCLRWRKNSSRVGGKKTASSGFRDAPHGGSDMECKHWNFGTICPCSALVSWPWPPPTLGGGP